MKNKINWLKQVLPLAAGLFISGLAHAQEATQAAATTKGSGLDSILSNTLLGMGILVAVGAIAALIKMNAIIMEQEKIRLLQEHGIEVMEKTGLLTHTEPAWKRLYKRMTRVVPVEREQDIVLDHNYDGIQELDNILPPWWLAMFYISIVFGLGYVGVQHFSKYGISSEEEYKQQVAEAEASVKEYLASQQNSVDETNATLITDAQELALGETVFQANCASCHGSKGGGGVGPNLTDEYWLHGGDVKDVFKTIKYGVPEKGMISWQAQLRPADMHKVASYILSLQGTKPENAKEPQGEPYTPSDSTNTTLPPVDSTATMGMNE